MTHGLSVVFSEALFTVARTWKQPQCPSTGEWMGKLWCIHTTEYYSVTKRKEFESVELRWMNLESITQSEVSQKEKNKYYLCVCVYGIWKNGTHEPTCRAGIETQM